MNRSLRVVHLCASDMHGGAARSAYRLHKAMRESGMLSMMCVKDKQSRDPYVSVLKSRRSGRPLLSRVRHYFDQWRLSQILAKRKNNGMFTLDSVPCSHGELPQHDILNIHWISGFLDCLDLVELLPGNAHFVWTLHDVNPFTGGCHFPGDCEKYKSMCSRCPILESEQENDLARRVWKRKMRFYAALKDKQVHLVSPSGWLAKTAESSPFFQRHEISIIPYGVDLAVYRPGDGKPMRSILNIPDDVHVILMLAARLSDLRKGGEPFLNALVSSGILGNRTSMLLTVGRDMPPLGSSVPYRAVGAIESEDILAGLYNCADMLLMPTLDDNLPNAALEAIACGVPVVSYETGGMPDIVGEQEAGILVPKGDIGALLDSARSLLRDTNSLKQKKEAARCRAEKYYAKELQASRYKSLYEDLLGNGGN